MQQATKPRRCTACAGAARAQDTPPTSVHLLAGPVVQQLGDVVAALKEVGVVVPAAPQPPAWRG